MVEKQGIPPKLKYSSVKGQVPEPDDRDPGQIWELGGECWTQ